MKLHTIAVKLATVIAALLLLLSHTITCFGKVAVPFPDAQYQFRNCPTTNHSFCQLKPHSHEKATYNRCHIGHHSTGMH